MNPETPIQITDFVPLCKLTATEVGYSASESHLTEILRSFNYRAIVITLARINLLLQRNDDFSKSESILRKNFCSPILRNAIDSSSQLRERIIFNRESTLRLLSTSVNVSDPRSVRTPDGTEEAKSDLAKCYLIANELSEKESVDSGTNFPMDHGPEPLAGLIPALEYAINSQPWFRIRKFLVRSKAFLTRLIQEAENFDVNKTFCTATGLTLEGYQYLIFSILSVASHYSPQEILKGEAGFINTKPSPCLKPLYDKLLQQVCVPIEDLPYREQLTRSLPSEYRLWREYPLVKMGENQIMCADIGFLLDKLETGVFWIINHQRQKKNKAKDEDIIGLWGKVFESYVASIIQRALPSIASQTVDDAEGYLINPKYDQTNRECTDVAVCGRETLILMECKAPILTAESKFSGDSSKFYKNLKAKIIEPKGLKQLQNAIQNLAHINEEKRLRIKGINMSRVKRIFPVLVFSDRIFSFPIMNWFLDSEFQRLTNTNVLRRNLEIMPLTVLTIDELESLEPYLCDAPFHDHLYKWITQVFKRSKSFPFTEYLRLLSERQVRENEFINNEVKMVSDGMQG